MKNESNGGRMERESGGRSAGTPPAPLPCVMKILAPDMMAAAIIGKGGSVIASIRQSCSAKIALTEHGEVYPTTDCRVLTAQASSFEQLNEVAHQIISKVHELAKSAGPNEAIGSEQELKLRALVPRAAVGGLIGKGGATIKQIRESSGAKVSISEAVGSGPASEQLVSISGSVQALEHVLQEVNKQIQSLNTEQWFATWAATSSASSNTWDAGRSYSGRGQASYSNAGIETMIRVANGMPPYVMEDSRGFALSCVVPNRLVGGLIGRGGTGTKEVQSLTGTKINIREIADDPEHRSLNIAGSLANACAAYMLMMKRYLDAEASAGGGASGP